MIFRSLTKKNGDPIQKPPAKKSPPQRPMPRPKSFWPEIGTDPNEKVVAPKEFSILQLISLSSVEG